MNRYLTKYKNICVLGLGSTGLSCLKFLQKNKAQYDLNIIAMDTRQLTNIVDLQAQYPEITIANEFDENVLYSSSLILASPGINLKAPFLSHAKSQGIVIIGDIELFAAEMLERQKIAQKEMVIAITGSNGKSTITDLTAKLLAKFTSVKCGGNIGIPALDLLDEPATSNSNTVYVLELSSFQLETTHCLKLQAACIINISPDHMDRYSSFEEYQDAKLKIFNNTDNIVINRDDAITQVAFDRHFKSSDFDTISYIGYDANVEKNHFALIEDNEILYIAYQGRKIISAQQVALQGKHNLLNIMASLALMVNTIGESYLQQPSLAEIKLFLKTYSGLAHRCEKVTDMHNILWINDSKATNPEACVSALVSFTSDKNKHIIWIAGGEGKGADFSIFKNYQSSVKVVILIGRDAKLIEANIVQHVDIFHAKTLDDALKIAKDTSVSGDIVLFSPACASFDMFNNFEHRGDCYKQLVLAMHEQALKQVANGGLK